MDIVRAVVDPMDLAVRAADAAVPYGLGRMRDAAVDWAADKAISYGLALGKDFRFNNWIPKYDPWGGMQPSGYIADTAWGGSRPTDYAPAGKYIASGMATSRRHGVRVSLPHSLSPLTTLYHDGIVAQHPPVRRLCLGAICMITLLFSCPVLVIPTWPLRPRWSLTRLFLSLLRLRASTTLTALPLSLGTHPTRALVVVLALLRGVIATTSVRVGAP